MSEAENTERDNRGQWFVVHTLSGHENKVRDTLLRQLQIGDQVAVYDAVVPTEKVSEVRQGVRKVRKRPLFPGYIWVRMDLYDPETREVNQKAWYLVRNIQGVLGFLGGTHKPTPLSDREVDEVLRPAEEGAPQAKPRITFEIGEVVRIKDGAFENFEGAVQEIDVERGKLKLSVSIFGRSTPVELEFWQVERTV